MKLKLPSNIYSNIYDTGPAPGKLYGTEKGHKLSSNDANNELPLGSIL